MLVNSTEFQNNVGKYIDLADAQEVIIIHNGHPVARLVGMEKSISFLSDRLLGMLPQEVDLTAKKNERLSSPC